MNTYEKTGRGVGSQRKSPARRPRRGALQSDRGAFASSKSMRAVRPQDFGSTGTRAVAIALALARRRPACRDSSCPFYTCHPEGSLSPRDLLCAVTRRRKKQVPHRRSPAIRIGGRDRVRDDTSIESRCVCCRRLDAAACGGVSFCTGLNFNESFSRLLRLQDPRVESAQSAPILGRQHGRVVEDG